MSNNKVEELTTVSVFHDHEQLLIGFNNLQEKSAFEFSYLVELNDVGVADLFENLNLASDAFNVLLVVNLLLLQDFDCNLLETPLLIQIKRTFSPVSTWLPCLTCPKVPLPSALPKRTMNLRLPTYPVCSVQ